MQRLALHLTCFVVAFALCAGPVADVREPGDTRLTLRKQSPETPQLGLPAPHAQPRAPLPPLFFSPDLAPTPRLTGTPVVVRVERHALAPELSWRARAHPAQAPPV